MPHSVLCSICNMAVFIRVVPVIRNRKPSEMGFILERGNTLGLSLQLVVRSHVSEFIFSVSLVSISLGRECQVGSLHEAVCPVL